MPIALSEIMLTAGKTNKSNTQAVTEIKMTFHEQHVSCHRMQ